MGEHTENSLSCCRSDPEAILLCKLTTVPGSSDRGSTKKEGPILFIFIHLKRMEKTKGLASQVRCLTEEGTRNCDMSTHEDLLKIYRG